MAITIYLQMLLLLTFLYLLYKWTSQITTHNPQSPGPKSWPIIGNIPGLLHNAHRIHDSATDFLKENGGTFVAKGPWFSNMNTLVTADPANIQYILSKNFSNYPKGPRFRKIFDILGDGIFNSDADLWQLHRETTMSLMKHAKFQNLLERVTWCNVENVLLPILDHFCRCGREMDLQDIFKRFSLDSICRLLLDYDPQSLSLDLPCTEIGKSIHDAEEAIFYRHILPEGFWRLQKKLQIGKEKKLSQAWETLDKFIYHCISLKKGVASHVTSDHQDEMMDNVESYSLLTSFMEAYKEEGGESGDPNKFLRDTLLSLLIAGRDSSSTALSWFFWLLAKNPSVEIKILEEIVKTKMNLDEKGRFFLKTEELRKLVYLHAAICEALRLYPPVSLNHKAPAEPDTLPSGHWIDRNTKVVLSYYSTGRMETIWGKDCLEFKPERWISEKGGIIYQPFFNFPAFNAGPRTCLGKDMTFMVMKIVASSIIYSYRVEVVEGQTIVPSESVVLSMKYGLKVRLSKRSV